MRLSMDEVAEYMRDGSKRGSMSTESQSKQAQANKINSIRHRVNDWKNHLEKNSLELPIGTLDSLALLEIVDSQAQTINNLERTKETPRRKDDV